MGDNLQDRLAEIESLREQIPRRVESSSLGDAGAEEKSIFDSGYNAALVRVHNILNMASAALANRENASCHGGGFLGGLSDATPAAALAQQAPDGWQPIETAPKVGCTVLIAGGTIQWPDSEPQPFPHVTVAYWYFDHWRGGDMQAHDQWMTHTPTHWMPLPAAPQQAPAAPSPDHEAQATGPLFSFRHPMETDEQFKESVDYANGWNACLAALRQQPAGEAK